jgi:hypothetical protein
MDWALLRLVGSSSEKNNSEEGRGVTHLLEGRADNLTEHNQTLGSGRIALNSAS